MNRSLLRLATWSLALALLALPIVAVLQGWVAGERWPIRVLAVEAPFALVDEAQIREVVAPLAADGFFAANPRTIREALLGLAWVDRVEVRKRWPDRIEVRLDEHHPYAFWGETRVLTEGGRLLPLPARVALELPRFDAVESRAAELLDFHRQARPLLLTAGEELEELRLSARGSWSITTRAGIHIELGRSDALPRLQRFTTLLPSLRTDPAGRPLLAADLRYTNGFALRFAPASPSPSPSPDAPRAASNV